MAAIELKGVSYKVSKQFALRDVTFSIPDGKTVVLLGPSGAGKSTLTRLIAGLVRPHGGTITMGGYDMHGIPSASRKVGMLFQNESLYPHYTSRLNILSYFMFHKKRKEFDTIAEDRLEETARLLDVDISYLLDRKPPSLSGGEKQRVALGRCITRDPRLFLMDDPFTNLDAPLRRKYRIHLKKLLHRFGVTTLFITHDQQEAGVLADGVVLVRDGRVVQAGSYADLYARPVNVFAAEFLNADTDTPGINLLPADLLKRGGSAQLAGIRPENVTVHTESGRDRLRARAVFVHPGSNPRSLVVEAAAGGNRVFLSAPRESGVSAGDDVYLGFGPGFLFEKKTGRRVG